MPSGKLLTRKYRDGLIRFCVLYTYGWSNPLASVGFREERREYFVDAQLSTGIGVGVSLKRCRCLIALRTLRA